VSFGRTHLSFLLHSFARIAVSLDYRLMILSKNAFGLSGGTRIFCLLALIAGGSALNAQTITLAGGSGQPGSSISLPISHTAGAQVSSLMWTLAYSASDFSNISVTAGPAATGAGKGVQCAATAPGRYTCIASGINSTNIASGTLATAAVTVASGTTATSSSIQILDAGAASPAGVNIGSSGTGATVTVLRPVSLSGVSCSPTAVTAPGSARCTVALTGAATGSGLPVSLGFSVTGASVSLPSSVMVPGGATAASFTLNVNSVSQTTAVQVTATALGITKGASVTVSPAVSSGQGISVAVSPLNATLTAGQTKQFSASVSGTTNTGIRWTVSPTVGTISSTGLYTAPASVASQQIVTVRASSLADSTKFAAASVIVNPVTGGSGSGSYTVFPTSATPAISSDADRGSVELGMAFTANTAGYVTGIRFYKGSLNTGTHTGSLWSASGQRLASVTFSNETASGWQQASFAQPVPISANTRYVVSYHAPVGRYSATKYYFTSSGIDNDPLFVPGGAAGVYKYGSSPAFPNQSYQNTNYWVDVVFKP
jgi:hypothetical protein